MANLVYNSFKLGLIDAGFDLGDGSVRALLVTSSYTPAASHTQYSHITNQVTGGGYTTGGQAIGTPTTALSSGTAVFDGDNVTWSSSTITAAGAVLYKYVDSSGSPAASSPLICFFDFGGNESSSDGDFTLQWHADGILRLGTA